VKAATSREYKIQWALFFLLGTINNFAYVIVLSAAQSLAKDFHQVLDDLFFWYSAVPLTWFSVCVSAGKIDWNRTLGQRVFWYLCQDDQCRLSS
jgi:hypothetical protein